MFLSDDETFIFLKYPYYMIFFFIHISQSIHYDVHVPIFQKKKITYNFHCPRSEIMSEHKNSSAIHYLSTLNYKLIDNEITFLL